MLWLLESWHRLRGSDVRLAVLSLCLLMIPQRLSAVSSYNEEINNLSVRLADNVAKSGKKTVAVVDFTTLGGEVIELGRFLAEELSVGLTQKASGFDVIDRTYLKA